MIGLGRMGGNLSRQAMNKGFHVVGYTKGEFPPDLIREGLVPITSVDGFRDKLQPPRIVIMYIPAGPAVDTVIDRLGNVLGRGDVIVDGGNSYWGDSIERGKRLKEKGIYFIDLGTSGGVEGAINGACFMAGGEDKAMELIEPIILAMSVPNGYVHTGPVGSGHYTKLVHNGIEFGMLQAIGEGVDLLANSKFKLDTQAILNCWRHGSVIRSWLIDLLAQEYREHDGMENIPSYVEDTGEVNWLVEDAIRMEVPCPVITLSVIELFTSRDKQKLWARAIAMMRNGFGGHAFGPDKATAEERKHGKVGSEMCRK
jgi:6-phosphogluconate dehydrogenase